MASIKLKRGDSIKWSIKYLQSNATTPVDLTGIAIDIDAYEKTNNTELFNITSTTPTANAYIQVTNALLGEFNIIIKDTSTFTAGTYLVDIEYTTVDGFKNSSKSFSLIIVDRL